MCPRVVFIPSVSKRADEAFSKEVLLSQREPRRLRPRLRRGRPWRQAEPKTFPDVLDLTQPLYEGFPTFGGDKWFTEEPFLTYAKDKLNINKWTLMEHTGDAHGRSAPFLRRRHSVDRSRSAISWFRLP